MLETKKKWSYKLMVADQLDRKDEVKSLDFGPLKVFFFQIITEEQFFLDSEFLEKSFGISFSHLETFDPKYKNTILLKIAQIDSGKSDFSIIKAFILFSGLIIGNCSFRGFLMSEMAYKVQFLYNLE